MEKFKNSKSRLNKIIIISLIIIMIGLFLCLLHFINKQKENNVNNLNPPNNADIIAYSNEDGTSPINIKCNVERWFVSGENYGDLTYVNPSFLTDSDDLECYIEFEFPSKMKVTDLYYEISFGNGFYFISEEKPYVGTLIEKDENEEMNLTYMYEPTIYESYMLHDSKNPNIISHDIFYENYNYGKSLLKYSLRPDTKDSDDLSIKVSNIVIKTSEDKYYSLKNENLKFSKSVDRYYIYYNTNGKLEAKSDYPSSYNIVDTYYCLSEDCKFIGHQGGNYFLFKDEQYVIYDIVSKKSIKLDEYLAGYDEIKSAHFDDDKLVGLIICKNGEIQECGYYSVEKSEMLTGLTDKICSNNEWINDYSGKLIDIYGNKYIANSNKLEKLYTFTSNNKAVYGLNAGCGDYERFFFDQNGVPLFDGKSGEFLGIENSILINYTHDKKFARYDKNLNLIFESKQYDSIDFWEDYVIVIENKVLKAVNYSGKTIVKFTTLNNDSQYFTPCSKDDYCVFVLDDTISKEEIEKQYKDDPFNWDEEWDYIKDSVGYIYSYNSKTKKLNKTISLNEMVE